MCNGCGCNQSRYVGSWKMQSNVKTQASETSSGSSPAFITEPPLPLRVALDARKHLMLGSSSRSRGRSLKGGSMKFCDESGDEDIIRIGPGPLLQAIPFPVDQILDLASLTSGI